MRNVMPLVSLQALYVGPVICVLAVEEHLLFLWRGCLGDHDRRGEGEERERGVADENGNKAECSRPHPEVF